MSCWVLQWTVARCSRGFGGYPLLDLEHAQKNCFPGSSRSNKMKREGFALCKTSTFQQIENGLIKPYETLTITLSFVIQKIFSCRCWLGGIIRRWLTYAIAISDLGTFTNWSVELSLGRRIEEWQVMMKSNRHAAFVRKRLQRNICSKCTPKECMVINLGHVNCVKSHLLSDHI